MKYTSINIKQTLAFTAAVVALGFLASCQRDAIVPDSLSGQELVPVTLKASMVQTKVTYDETSKRNLQPSWEKNDKVIGFDENAKTYEFEVSAVEADGSATLTGTAPAKCTLHLIYLCGATASSIKVEEKTASVAVDYRNQAGDKTLPAVMLADGELSLGTGEFHFRNAGAVIGIDAVMGVPSGKTISKVTIHGDNLSAATIALDGSGLTLTNEGSTGESISTATLTGITVTDGVGNLSTPILIAVPAGAKVSKVSATVVEGVEYTYTLPAPSTFGANQYAYVAGKTFSSNVVDLGLTVKWGTCNIGASKPEEYGRYFAWGDVVGQIPANIGENAFSTAYISQNMPFGNITSDNMSNWLTDYTLKPEFDAAHVILGGNWRMPTKEEIQELVDNTSRQLITDYNGSGVSGYLLTSKKDGFTDQSIFLPNTGLGDGTNLTKAGSIGYYWSSSFNKSNKGNAYRLSLVDPDNGVTGSNGRFQGRCIRPVLVIE